MSYIDGFNMNPIIFVVRNDWCRVDDNDTVVGGSVVENIDFYGHLISKLQIE